MNEETHEVIPRAAHGLRITLRSRASRGGTSGAHKRILGKGIKDFIDLGGGEITKTPKYARGLVVVGLKEPISSGSAEVGIAY
jgi:hypothetical protein